MPEISTSVSSRLYYRKMGAGPAVVLLHGFPESSNLWRYVWGALSARYTLIMPDMPGSGYSVLDKETGIDDMADCVKSIMDAESIDKAVIAGHSMGGYIAFEFAARYPARLAGLSLVHSTPVADDEAKIKTRLKAIELINNGGKDAFVRQMVTSLFAENFKKLHPGVIAEQVALSLEMESSSLINFYYAMIGRHDRAGILPLVNFPVQWIIGLEDNVINYKNILVHCYKSTINFVTFYNNCSHMSMFEAPGQLIQDLTAFIDYCYAHYRPR